MFSSFSRILICIAIAVVGLFLIGDIPIRLKPITEVNTISISYSWPNRNPRLVEDNVTHKLEQLFSSSEGLVEINSISNKGEGVINLVFHNKVNLNLVELNLSSKLRQIYPQLPEEVTFPTIKNNVNGEKGDNLFMSFSIESARDFDYIKKQLDNTLIPRLSKIKGISDVQVDGLPKYAYIMHCKLETINRLGLSIADIEKKIKDYYYHGSIGSVFLNNEKLEISIPEQSNKPYAIKKLLIKNKKGELIAIKDLIEIEKKVLSNTSYRRVNGNNSLTISIDTYQRENQILIAEEVKKVIESIKRPDDFKIHILYDASIELTKELNNASMRTILSLSILICFVLLIGKGWRYSIVILASIIINLLFGIIFFYFFEVQLHLYSFIGLMVSVGIVIDNLIVMIDHLMYNRSKGAFWGILGATLTTICPLSIIYFLNDSYQFFLLDFSLIIISNLVASLIITYFFVPALFEKLIIARKSSSNSMRNKRIIVRLNYSYIKILNFLMQKKLAVFVLTMFLFGFPFFFIPKKLNEKVFLSKEVNSILNSEFYNDYVLPNYKFLGGTLFHFIEKAKKSGTYSTLDRSFINVQLTTPEGATLKQLDLVVQKFELFIQEFEQVEVFRSDIFNENSAVIKIYIKSKYENGEFPFRLKSLLESIGTQLGGVNCSITGIGLGFSNSAYDITDSSIKLTGYNLDKLLDIANQVKDSVLLAHPKINTVGINSESSWFLKRKSEYVLQTYNLLQNSNVDYYQIIQDLKLLTGQSNAFFSWNNIPFLVSINKEQLNGGQMLSQKIELDSSYYNFGQLFKIAKRSVTDKIVKRNNEYQLFLDYNFNGTFQYNVLERRKLIDEISTSLPLGYKVSDPKNASYFSENSNILVYLVIIMIMIYLICAILFESLIQPFAIILTVPISFIGIFLTFSLSDIPFDRGGIASFVMLSGIVVNSSIYIVNEYNFLIKERKYLNKVYIKAFNAKIIPIMLTIISTILGLFPFIFINGSEYFWTSFAYSMIGGLLFSIVSILFFLPLFLPLKGFTHA